MTNNCPHCGNAIRPGARFCGSCGKSLQEQPAARSVQSNCPHCGMPLKTDANFCPHCGMSVPVIASPAMGKIEKPADITTPPIPVPQTVTINQEPPIHNWLLIGIIIILIVIVLVFFGYIAWDNNWLGLSGTDTPTAAGTLVDSATPSPILETEFEPTPSLTVAPAPTFTELPAQTSQPIIVLGEEFEGELQENWIVWGTPEPEIVQGFTHYLEFDAQPGAAGVTSKVMFELNKVDVQYEAALSDSSPNNILSLDWDPGESIRKPGELPGYLHLDIGNGRLLLTVPDQAICDLRLPEAVAQTITIEIETNTISLTINGELFCPPTTVDLLTGDGRLSFSGGGRMDSVLIVQRWENKP